MSQTPPEPPPPPPPPTGPPGVAVPMAPPNNQKAVWSLVAGILSILCCGIIAGPVAIILGQAAKTEIRASGGAQGGEGMAQAGFIMGIIGTALYVLAIIFYFLFFAALISAGSQLQTQ